MKNRVALLLFLVLCVIAGVLLLRKHARQAPPLPLQTNATSVPMPTSNGIAVKKPEAKPWVRPPGVDEAGWKYLSTIRDKILTQNQPIEFYARVVDQDGNPVIGARLELKLTRVDAEKVLVQFPHMKMGEEQTTQTNFVYSDDGGYIRFVGATGHYLDIWDLSKEGYSSNIPHNFETLTYEPGGKRNVNHLVEMGNAFNSEIGYTFHLWKKGTTERLVGVNYTIGVDPDATNWHAVNLFRGPVEDVGMGDFLFQIGSDKDTNGNFARRFRYQARFGGLMVDAEPYPYLAPAQGYEQDWEWFFEPRGRNEKDDVQALLKRKFYVKGRNGKMYAALTWNWYTANAVQITGYVNPTGSRNLEPDAEQLITDPAEIQRLDEQTRVR